MIWARAKLTLQGLKCTLKQELYNQKFKAVTFLFHSHGQAFVQPTSLAPISVDFIDRAGLISLTTVVQVFPNTPLEKALTALARNNAVMFSSSAVSTHKAVSPDLF